MIQVTDLTRRYGAAAAVHALSFSVEEGEIIGLLGPNGAGKTTTMNLLTGCLQPTSGSICIGGYNMETHADEARKLIGYLPENPPLYPDMTVTEYLTFVYQLKKCQLPMQEHLTQIIAMCSLTEVRRRLIRNLSKGFRQRIGLAQALVGNPKVLILDEPTVGLDPKQIIEIRTLIRSLGKNHTILLSSHILPEVQAICDRILVLHQGQLAADGTPEALRHKIAQAEQLEMTIEGDAAAILPILRAVPGTVSADLIHPDGKKSMYRISAEPNTEIRHGIFDALSQNHMTILSMQQAALSLEDIFLELTEDKPAAEQNAVLPKNIKTKRRFFGRKDG